MFGDLLHVAVDDIRDSFIEAVGSFSGSEIDIIVLGTASGDRVGMRVQSVGFESLNGFHVYDRLQEFLIHDFYFLDLMRSSETVKEMNER